LSAIGAAGEPLEDSGEPGAGAAAVGAMLEDGAAATAVRSFSGVREGSVVGCRGAVSPVAAALLIAGAAGGGAACGSSGAWGFGAGSIAAVAAASSARVAAGVETDGPGVARSAAGI